MVRWHSTRDAAVRASRRATARCFDVSTRHNFRKRHPLDCGNTRCGLCHPDKFVGRRRETRQERLARLRLDDWLLPT